MMDAQFKMESEVVLNTLMETELKTLTEAQLKTPTEAQLKTLTEARIKDRKAQIEERKAQIEERKALLKQPTEAQLKKAQLKKEREDCLKDEMEALSTLDNASVENMKKLEKIGKSLLQKNVARVNMDTGKYWPISGAPRNTEELARFAGLLSKERKRRIGYSKQEALLFLVFLAAIYWKR
jgi:histone deacetylase complex regulatory component SIN3